MQEIQQIGPADPLGADPLSDFGHRGTPLRQLAISLPRAAFESASSTSTTTPLRAPLTMAHTPLVVERRGTTFGHHGIDVDLNRISCSVANRRLLTQSARFDIGPSSLIADLEDEACKALDSPSQDGALSNPAHEGKSMLRNIKNLEHCAIDAIDGQIGKVEDFYFDDESWVVRYLVVEAGSWLSNRKVLISPISVGTPNWTEKVLPVTLTRKQVRDSPPIDTREPVTRQHERDYLGYYGYPYYWGNSSLWGASAYPSSLLADVSTFGGLSVDRAEEDVVAAQLKHQRENDDPHLRSCNAVTGYHIKALDGEMGHLAGMLVDEETWAIRYLIVHTSNWWLGHDVLVAPQWIQSLSWATELIAVDFTREALQRAPRYDPTLALDRSMEIALHEHYRRTGYWLDSRIPVSEFHTA
jgi:hypothetical protein